MLILMLRLFSCTRREWPDAEQSLLCTIEALGESLITFLFSLTTWIARLLVALLMKNKEQLVKKLTRQTTCLGSQMGWPASRAAISEGGPLSSGSGLVSHGCVLNTWNLWVAWILKEVEERRSGVEVEVEVEAEAEGRWLRENLTIQ